MAGSVQLRVTLTDPNPNPPKFYTLWTSYTIFTTIVFRVLCSLASQTAKSPSISSDTGRGSGYVRQSTIEPPKVAFAVDETGIPFIPLNITHR